MKNGFKRSHRGHDSRTIASEWVRFETMAGDNHLIGIEQLRKVCEEWSWTNKITGTVVTFPANECEGLFRSSDRNGDGFIDVSAG